MNTANNNNRQENTSEKSIPNGFKEGRAEPYMPKSKSEENMISQFGSYSAALFLGDIENAFHYLYTDAFSYLKEQYIKQGYNLSEEKLKKEALAMDFESFDKIFGNADYELVVIDIIRKVDIQTTKIYVFDVRLVVSKRGSSISTISKDTNIGISFNNGTNWTFTTLYEGTPSILRRKFSNDVVNQVMGY